MYSSLRGVHSTEQRPDLLSTFWKPRVKSRDGDRVQSTLLSVQTWLEVKGGQEETAKLLIPRPHPQPAFLKTGAQGRGLRGLGSLARAWVWFTISRELSLLVCCDESQRLQPGWRAPGWGTHLSGVWGTPHKPHPRICHLYSEQGPTQSPAFRAKVLQFCFPPFPSRTQGRES